MQRDVAYILFTEHAESTHDAMTLIAQRSTLPAQARPVRLTDFGYVRSIRRDAQGVHITLDRAVRFRDRIVDNNPATYRYVIPADVFDSSVRVGGLIGVFGDGTRVTMVVRY